MANVLIVFGFSWMVVAALIGLFLARRHELSQVKLEELAGKGNLLEYHQVNAVYKWNKTVHAHSFLFSVVSVAIGLSIPKMNYTSAVTDVLASVLIMSVVVWTVGGLRSSRPLMVVGDLSLLVSLLTTVVGLAKAL